MDSIDALRMRITHAFQRTKGFFGHGLSVKEENVAPPMHETEMQKPQVAEVVLMMHEQQQQEKQTTELEKEVEPSVFVEQTPSMSYATEFVKLINRNAPQGTMQKIQNIAPYLAISLASWPAYWLYRGYHWQRRRGTERIELYIQRTFQHAKAMQIAILAAGLVMASLTRSLDSLPVHELKGPAKVWSAEQATK